MRPEHPTDGELMELSLPELAPQRRAGLEAHTSGCETCQEALAELGWLARSLAAGPEEDPPADGLERVLSGLVATRTPADAVGRWRPAVASLAGVALSSAAILGLGLALPSRLPVEALAGLGPLPWIGLAALLFFGVGSFVTLALAPVLILDSRAQARPTAAR